MEYIHDEFGRTIKTIETSGNKRKTTESIFDKNGKIKSSKDEIRRVTTYEYDEQGRLIKVDLNNESFNVYEYDDENFNDDGKLKSVSTITTDALGRKSRVETNGEGKTLSITDESNNRNMVTSYEYDTGGNISKVKYTDGGYKKYTYDEYDILQTSVSYNNKNQAVRSILYMYDEEDRLICRRDSRIIESVETPYRYTCYTYDQFGRMAGISEINSKNEPSREEKEKYMTKYTYNVDDYVTKIEYPDNSSDELKGITFKYNKDKWITEIHGILKDNTSVVIRAYEYYNDGKTKNIKDFFI